MTDNNDSFKVPASKVASKKVTNMVGTFLTDNNDGFKVPASKVASEKVTNTVGTFLTDNSDGFKVPASKSGIGKGYQYGGNLFDQGRP